MKHALSLGGILLSLAVAGSGLRSQVVISEIEFTPRGTEGQWIEIYNAGTKSVPLETWSIYQATLTANKPQNYWWGFPKGTTIAPKAFLRIHWLEKIQPSTKTDIYTGNTVFHFLFGLFAERLDPNRGALALYSTKVNTNMNTPSFIQDWVSWGTSGFKRESLAVTNNRWVAKSFAPIPSGKPVPSLAYDMTSLGKAHSGREWFLDSTPTPGRDNVGGAFAKPYGSDCKGGLAKLARLEASGIPAPGNKGFYLGIDRALAATEFAFWIIGAKPGDGTFKIAGCSYWLDPLAFQFIDLAPKQGTVARLTFGAIPDKVLAGLHLYTTWTVIEVSAGKLGFTKGYDLQFGR